MVVGGAHRLRNRHSSLFSHMRKIRAHHIVLLTGTPIQNKIAELGTLLHFLEPKRFPGLEEFEARFGNPREQAEVDALLTVLEPYLLRR
mmetsp:Transcript_14621/g.35660  ORF Transcript_14621/g.35660 Transcript_14621/m.35660 type:complete len:89 (-) Transcript_14621:318-584(-)